MPTMLSHLLLLLLMLLLHSRKVLLPLEVEDGLVRIRK
jgi:hypothetical protein